MITLNDYFGPWIDHEDATAEMKSVAVHLLAKVNPLLEVLGGGYVNPKTKTLVSGDTLGGFRPQSSSIGAPNSAHKVARAVDVYDPTNTLDKMITDLLLEQYGLYREHPSATPGWCHLSDRAPPSGKRTFYP